MRKIGRTAYLHRSGDYYYWTQEQPGRYGKPRSVTSDNFVIVDETDQPEVIGEVDFSSALSTVHPKAIYMHAAQQYDVERLEFEQRKAYVRRVDVDYFTQAIRYTQVKKLKAEEEQGGSGARDQSARRRPGSFPGCRIQKNKILYAGKRRIGKTRIAGRRNAYDGVLDNAGPGISGYAPLYHLRTAERAFGAAVCTRIRGQPSVDVRPHGFGATIGEGALESEGDPREWPGTPESSEGEFFEPTLYLYDAYPGGIGLSEPLFHLHDLLIRRTRELIASCQCDKGCPSCVGPAGETGERAKEAALAILDRLSIRDSRFEIQE